MVFSLGDIINRSADTFCSSGIVNTLSSNIFVATAILLIITMVIIIAVVSRSIERKKMAKVLLYLGIAILIVLSIHYYAMSAKFTREYQGQTGRTVYDKINNAGNDDERVPVVPMGEVGLGNTPLRFNKEAFGGNETAGGGDTPRRPSYMARKSHREDNVKRLNGAVGPNDPAPKLNELGLETIELPV